MSREWKPGDVVAITEYVGDPIPAIRVEAKCGVKHHHVNHDHWHYLRPAPCGATWTSASDPAAHALVVIDPEDAEQVERLADLLAWALHTSDTPRLADALREFADPKPRIEEPANWLSVIRDNEGIEWYRWSVRPKDRDQAWVPVWDEGRCYPTGWDDIHAVEIVSAGIELAE